MIEVSATAAAHDLQRLLDQVERGETVLIRAPGRARVEMRRRQFATKAQVVEMFKGARFTEAEQRELTAAMKAANDYFTNGDRA